MTNLSPPQIVQELNKYIVGQNDAKRAVAIALRNRWRRMQLSNSLKVEVTPKNILMIGPTGVGKTEIARRLAKLTHSPFIKVEATKFTEVGYVGRDVESIIRDLVEVAYKTLKEEAMTQVRMKAEDLAEERVLDALLPQVDTNTDKTENGNTTRQLFRKRLREGSLDDKEIDIKIKEPSLGVELMTPPGMEEMASQLQGIFANLSPKSKPKMRRLKVKDAMKCLTDEEAASLVKEDEIKLKVVDQVEQNGIVFIDELDKVVKKGMNSSADVSREGVQRDLLPLIEGCTVSTKYGMVRTDYILFIASGAFHLSKPSDLIPEIQGRLPIRVELKSLSVDDFVKILVEPDASLTEQYQALLATEGLFIKFSDEGIYRIAELSWQVNESTENIGARRLHTLLERLLEDISFSACSLSEQYSEAHPFIIDAEYVEKQLGELTRHEDLTRYIL